MGTSLRVGYDARMALGAYRGMGSVLRDAIDNQEAEFIGLCATGESDATLRLEPGGARGTMPASLMTPHAAREITAILRGSPPPDGRMPRVLEQ